MKLTKQENKTRNDAYKTINQLLVTKNYWKKNSCLDWAEAATAWSMFPSWNNFCGGDISKDNVTNTQRK